MLSDKLDNTASIALNNSGIAQVQQENKLE